MDEPTSDKKSALEHWWQVLNNFITQIIDEQLAQGKFKHTVTRFPPEPNGWLHLGHAKSICLNFGLARQYKGRCHLRFDDTNPAAEEEEYIEGIKKDISWLGFRWNGHLYYASDYFEQLYQWAEQLIKANYAYVDEQTEEEVRVNRGSLTEPGKNSPYRDRPIQESLDLFRAMRDGKIEDGKAILRAKIDMTHGNMNMRDPPIYRIKRNAVHPRTGDKWNVYPIYDFAHGQSDSIEKITHSICTLEFYDHRPLYEWFQEVLGIYRTQQIEFARFNLSHTVMSKRRLLKLVKEGYVRGWDDPRMPTLAGCRRRGFPASAIRKFAYDVGVARRENVIPLQKLEGFVREELHSVQRRMGVVTPLKVVITNWTQTEPEDVVLPNHPDSAAEGTRVVKFGPVIYIDQNDFAEVPPPKWHRLTPGGEVRLRGSYWLKCDEVIKSGESIQELRCSIDHTTKGGVKPSENPRSVKGVIHWVSEVDSVEAEMRMYDRLFTCPDPDEGGDWLKNLNPASLVISTGRVEKSIKSDPIGSRYQLERVGFFVVDEDTSADKLVLNLSVSLQDTFAGMTDEKSKEAQAKLEAKLAREKAAEERRLIKLAREEREAAKKAAAKQTDA